MVILTVPWGGDTHTQEGMVMRQRERGMLLWFLEEGMVKAGQIG